jgi:hypothetical protein
MNGLMAPEYFHADLLHPARRLWKRRLPDCSQATIEVSVLGLDRDGDVSGALAPDIWFSFLRSGDNRELLSICEHSVRDILGLASLFLGLAEIAAAPLESRDRFGFDLEALAFSWRGIFKKSACFFKDDESRQCCAETGELLLKSAAENGSRRAALALALDFFKKGQCREGRALLLKIAADASNDDTPDTIKTAALRSLAIDAEWRLGDHALALDYTNSALAVPNISESLRKELERRRVRLAGKERLQ